MFKRIVSIFRRLSNKIAIHFYDEYTLADFYRKTQGVKIGNRCRIIGKRLHMFGGEPYLIEIGNQVTIAEDVKFITHDGGVGVLRNQTPGLNVFGKIVIRDNCFIGVNSILMLNVTIGPNAVVGAGAVVTRDVPPNTVAAGIPAKVIMSFDEYHKKALDKGMLLSSKDEQDKKQQVLQFIHSKQENHIIVQDE